MRRSAHGVTDVLAQQIAAGLDRCGLRQSRIVVGLSGGIDSVVLLHLLRVGLRIPAAQLAAIHVNHQISAQAGAWATHCRRYCRELGVKLRVARVEVARGNSIEAAARTARYRIFATAGAGVIALAHNRDDQAETVLLQLLRGAGPRGLSAMPELKSGKPAVWRPLLAVPRSVIAAYARRHCLQWVEDDSNLDRGYLRNFIRHDVLPLIERQVPAARVVLARAARLQAEASDLLDALAEHDLGGGACASTLPVALLRALPAHRARNVLRRFLRDHAVAMPDAVRAAELLRQAITARQDAQVCVDLGGVELRRFNDELHIVRRLPPLPAEFLLEWRGRGVLSLPLLGGALRMERGAGRGIALDWLQRCTLTVRVRSGGEKLRLTTGAARRTVRNLLQEAGLPPWERERLPMLYLNDELAAVPGIGVDARFQCLPGRPGRFPLWLPERAVETSGQI